MKKTDIVIIGAGMAGISAAVYLKRANANFVLLEGNFVGGMLNQLKSVQNYPAMANTTGSDILIALVDQLRFNEIPVIYGNVQTILKEEDGFEEAGRIREDRVSQGEGPDQEIGRVMSSRLPPPEGAGKAKRCCVPPEAIPSFLRS